MATKKRSYYFPHDFAPTDDLKIVAMLGEFGASGYGLYWRFIEKLHSEESHTLPHKKYLFSAIAQQMSTSVEEVQKFVDYCISICELFESDGESFWSNRVFVNIEKMESISESRSEAGKKSAEIRAELKKATSVEQMLTSVEQNSTKEKKIKEIKKEEEKEEKEKILFVLYSTTDTNSKIIFEYSKATFPTNETDINAVYTEFCIFSQSKYPERKIFAVSNKEFSNTEYNHYKKEFDELYAVPSEEENEMPF